MAKEKQPTQKLEKTGLNGGFLDLSGDGVEGVYSRPVAGATARDVIGFLRSAWNVYPRPAVLETDSSVVTGSKPFLRAMKGLGVRVLVQGLLTTSRNPS